MPKKPQKSKGYLQAVKRIEKWLELNDSKICLNLNGLHLTEPLPPIPNSCISYTYNNVIVKRSKGYRKALDIIDDWVKANNTDIPLDLQCLGLKELPPIPSNCKRLYCTYNKLTTLPKLYVTNLACSHNRLTALSELPNCTALWCEDNKLTCLPELPKCTYLVCCLNSLTTLPDLPACKHLRCENNSLTTLPELPECTHLYCQNNKLTVIKSMPKCLGYDCQSNNMYYLPHTYASNKSWFVPSRSISDNIYLHLTHRQAQRYRLKETPNYYRCATVIQRNFRNYLRRKYQPTVSYHLFNGPAKIVMCYAI